MPEERRIYDIFNHGIVNDNTITEIHNLNTYTIADNTVAHLEPLRPVNVSELEDRVIMLETRMEQLQSMFENIRIEAENAGLLRKQKLLSELLKYDTTNG